MLLPQGRVSSAGQEALEFAETCGLFLDDWQAWCLDQILSEQANGVWAASQAGMIVPRQNGKNSVLEAVELAALYLFDEKRIIHTAHLADTAAAHMKRMVELVAENPDLDKITHAYFSNGKERLERTDNGGVIEFVTRGKKTKRGASPQRLIFDEALYLTDEQMQAILPSLSAQSMNDDGGPQIIYTSSAPLPESEVLHRVRQRGIEGKSTRMFYAEWSCEEGVEPTDRDAWYQSNPGMGIRISEDWVAEVELPPGGLSVEGFLVERLGVVAGADSGSHVIPAGKWAEALDSGSQTVGQVCLAVDVSPERAWSSLAIAGRRADGLAHVEVIMREPGTGWLVDACKAASKAQNCPVRVANHGPAAGTLLELQRAEVPIVEIGETEFVKACSALQDAALNGRLRHIGQGPLDAAIVGAEITPVGDSWKWSRKSSAVDITPLVAVTLAHAGVDPAKRAVYAY